MSPLPTVNALVRSATWRDGAGVRAATGAGTFQPFDGERASGHGFQRTVPGFDRRRQSSHNGTTEVASLWNGPTLRPAFVAQVLGQVMMDGAAASLAAQAYRGRIAKIACLLDADV